MTRRYSSDSRVAGRITNQANHLRNCCTAPISCFTPTSAPGRDRNVRCNPLRFRNPSYKPKPRSKIQNIRTTLCGSGVETHLSYSLFTRRRNVPVRNIPLKKLLRPQGVTRKIRPSYRKVTMPKEKPKVNIGEVIRSYRSDRGLSQGDIERRTGLLRCYLSRVENGHTVPSLETLAKIAEAMEISLADFFPGTDTPQDRETRKMLGELSEEEIRFLADIKRYSTSLSDDDKRLVLAMIRKMATIVPPARNGKSVGVAHRAEM